MIAILMMALVLVFGPWVALFVVNSSRKREEESAHQRWTELSRRVDDLELEIRKLSKPAVQATAPVITQPVPKPQPVAAPPAPMKVTPAPIAPPAVPEPEFVPPPPFASEDRPKEVNLEEVLGTNWLNKIGIVILVLGVVLFLVYQLRVMGAGGKILVGLTVSAALLGGGIALERRPIYKIIGRACIAGGWALAFFTTYAMYHVEVTRILSSQLPDLALMLVVAAAMVAHTLRYKSEVVTGLAFLLAFSTLTISQVTVYSLSAEIVLALGLVVVVWRTKWYALEAFGIAAAYFNHWWWVRRIIEPMGSDKHGFPEFVPSVTMLLLYWAIFRVSYIIRECDERQERISTGAALLNSVGLLALLSYQAAHLDWAFWALLALGGVELGLALLPITRRRRMAFLVLATIGIALLVAAIPFRFTGGRLATLWIFEAEALLVAGIVVKEVLYRRLAMLATVVAAIDILVSPAQNFRMAALCLLAAGVFFGNSHWVTRRWPTLFEEELDRTVMHWFSFAGAFMLYTAVWAAFPGMKTAPAWAIAGLALLIIGKQLKLDQLPYEAHFFFGSSVALALGLNLPKPEGVGSVALIALLLYAASRWSAMAAVYRWAGASLLILLIYYDVAAMSEAPAGALLGLLLLEAGLGLTLKDLRLQGYAALGVAFAAIFFVNLNAAGLEGGILPLVYTVIPVVMALYYVYVRVESVTDEFEARFHVAELAGWCGAIAVAALLRFVLSSDWVAAAWAGGASTLLLAAVISRRATFLQQALFLCAAAALRTGLHNLYERSYLPGPLWYSRAVCAGAAIVLLLAGLPMAFRLKTPATISKRSGIMRAFLSACVSQP
jgi:hypothetical protein